MFGVVCVFVSVHKVYVVCLCVFTLPRCSLVPAFPHPHSQTLFLSLHSVAERGAAMKCSAKQLPFVCSCVALIAAGVLFFAFPYVEHTHTPVRLIWCQSCLHGHCRVRNIVEALLRLDNSVLLVVPVFAAVSQGLLFLLVCSTFFLASFVDPGIYPRGESG